MASLITPGTPFEATTVTVLFVDDDPAVLRAISRVFAVRTGFNALTATSSEEALALLRGVRVDVLVSDIEMPNVSGLDLIRRVRREFPSVLRILLTGAGTMERAITAINEGEVIRFFAKPFDPDTFIRALSDLGERILKLRREHYVETQRERCDQFFRWVEERYPGTLDFARNLDGAVIVDTVRLGTYAASAPAEVRLLTGVGRWREPSGGGHIDPEKPKR